MVQAALPQTAIKCLTAIAQYRGVAVDPQNMIARFELAAREPSTSLVLHMAREIGFKADLETLTWQSLFANVKYPLLARLSNGNWVVIVGTRAQSAAMVAIVDPLEPTMAAFLLAEKQFCSRWSGEVLALEPNTSSMALAA